MYILNKESESIMGETEAVLQTMEFGVNTSLKIAKEMLELMLRFINFIIARYEKSKEFKMKYSDMNKEQQQRRKGYLNAKQMKKMIQENNDSLIPINFGKELSEAEADKLALYAELMNFPYTFIEEPMMDKEGNTILDENGEIKVKRTYFCLQSDMDKLAIFLEVLNKDKQHEIIENSDLSEEEKEQLHREVDMENDYAGNEEVVQNMTVDRAVFYEAMKTACEEKNFEQLENIIKEENIKFYSGEKNGFTATMNKNAGRDYSRGESYYVVDALNTNHYIKLTSVYNKEQKRTDTTYEVYKNGEMIYSTNDKISEETAKKYKEDKGKSFEKWNPNWNNIREKIAEEGEFEEEGHYFVFGNEEEFSHYKEMFEQNIDQYTINPEHIKQGMDYDKERANIDLQMQTNTFYRQQLEQGLSKEEIENVRLSPEEITDLGSTLDKVDYEIFANNMEQKAALDKLEILQLQIDEKQEELESINFDNPLETMEKNGKLMDEITSLSDEYDLYAKYLGQLANQERALLSSHAEEVVEQKARNKDASKVLSNYRANKVLKENKLDLKEFSKEQQEEIKKGLADGLSVEQVKSYMNKEMPVDEMKIRRVGMEEGLKNSEIDHCVELFQSTDNLNLSIVEDAMMAYQAGLTKEQVDFAVDKNMPGGMREQFIEGVKENIPQEKMQVIKNDYYKNHVTKKRTENGIETHGDGKDLTVRTSTLLKFANSEEITKEDMENLVEVKSDEALENIYKAYEKGLKMDTLKPVIQKNITPEQVQGIANILFTEKTKKEKAEKKEKEPSKEQFQKAHEWAKAQNEQNNSRNMERGKDAAKENHSGNAR